MSDVTTIFIFGCCVMGVVLAATLIALIPGDGAKPPETTAIDDKTEATRV